MAVTIGSKAVGSIVKLKENGVLTDYIVVHQGLPSAEYDASCTGTWLLRKDITENRQWHSDDINDYANSTVHGFLNSAFLSRFDANTQGAICLIKIPYRPGSGTATNVNSGVNGLPCKMFFLSAYEVGWTNSDNPHYPADGAKLNYFIAGIGTGANDKRVAYLSGSAADWWLRAPCTDRSSMYAWSVSNYGTMGARTCSDSRGIRPALIISPSAWILDDSSVFVNQPPTAPSSVTVPTTIKGGTSIAVSWGAASDADGNLVGYQLERSVNGGAYAQIYQGTALAFTDSITRGWTSVAYRVRAYDAEWAVSGYRDAPARTIINNLAPQISGADGRLGTLTKAFSQTYSVSDDDGDPITVTEKLDSTVLRTFAATAGTQYTVTMDASAWQKVLNGNHTLTVTASDNQGGVSVRTWTFAKSVTAMSITLTAPLPADAMPTRCVVNVTGIIAAGALYTVEVCNNGNDTAPTWENCTQEVLDGRKHFFSNQRKTAANWGFNIRVSADRSRAGGDCFISGLGGNFD